MIIPAAVEVFREFYGLHVDQYGPGRDLHRRSFAIEPAPAAACAGTLAGLGRELGTRLFPIGEEGDHESILAVAETAEVYALDHAGTWHLGDTIDAALITLITGAQPSRLNSRGASRTARSSHPGGNR